MFTDPVKNIDQIGLNFGEKVADFGSGSGFYARHASRAVGPTGRIYAIDIQKDLLAKLKGESQKEGLFNIEVIWGDIERAGGTKLRDALLDAVIFSNILFQVGDKEGTIAEAYRVLKTGGKVLLVDWTDSFGGLGPRRDQIVTKDRAKEIFESKGFQFIKDIAAGEHHYGLLFKKI